MRALLLATLLTLAASAALPLTPQLFPEVTLRGGEAQAIPDTGVTLLLTRIDDQRCPADVDCYWEGMIRAEITVLGPQDDQQQIVLCNLCEDGTGLATAGGLTIGLVSLAPSTEELAKYARLPILSDYELTVNYAPATP